MKKTMIIFLLLLMIFMQPASAFTTNELEMKVTEYNNLYAEQIPSVLESMLGNERIHVLIDMNDDSEMHFKSITENSVITTFEEINPDEDIEATIKVIIKENAVDQLLESDNPPETFLSAMKSKDIVIKPAGIVDTIKFQVAGLLLKLSDLLGIV